MACKTLELTYQTRPEYDANALAALSEWMEINSSMIHTLFKRICAGKDPHDLKSSMMAEFGATARQFNAARVDVEGRIASCKEQQKAQIKDLRKRLATLDKKIENTEQGETLSAKERRWLHENKRKRERNRHKLGALEKADREGKVSLCFGGKRLFHAQHAREENGYASHEEWLAAWRESRTNQFMVLGSKDESGGNQTCTATIAEDGSLTLRLRLPNALIPKYGKYLILTGVRFAYGHEEVCRALRSCTERAQRMKDGDPTAKSYGEAIQYRFRRDAKGITLFATVSRPKPASVTSKEKGVLGIDLNADHVAVTEMDRFGNPVASHSFPMVTYGKSLNQAEALIGDVCAAVVALAIKTGKPLVHEDLDFSAKKRSLSEGRSPKYARMLSSFAYNQFASTLLSRAWRQGVDLRAVNPAYTSVIGRVKFARRYGLTVHQAAACVIGRRFLRLSERAPRHLGPIPDGRNGHVTLPLPARKRGNHVWKFWAALAKDLTVALAARFRTTEGRSSRPPDACDVTARAAGGTPARESATSTARVTS